MDIVLRLRELRRGAGLSQKNVARRSGIGEKTLSSFETGQRVGSMKLAQLERIVRVYGIDCATFFSPALAATLAGDPPPVFERIRAAVAELTPEAQETIATMVATVARTLPRRPRTATAPSHRAAHGRTTSERRSNGSHPPDSLHAAP